MILSLSILICVVSQISFLFAGHSLRRNNHYVYGDNNCLRSFLFLTRRPPPRPDDSPTSNSRSEVECPPQHPNDDAYEYRPAVWLLSSAESNAKMEVNHWANAPVEPVTRDVLTYEIIDSNNQNKGSGRVIVDFGHRQETRDKREAERKSASTGISTTELKLTETAAVSHNSTETAIPTELMGKNLQHKEKKDNSENNSDVHYSSHDNEKDSVSRDNVAPSNELQGNVSPQKSRVNETKSKICVAILGGKRDFKNEVVNGSELSTLRQPRRTRKTTTPKVKSTTTLHWIQTYHHRGHDCHFHFKNHSSRHEHNYYKHEPLNITFRQLCPPKFFRHWSKFKERVQQKVRNDSAEKTIYTLSGDGNRRTLKSEPREYHLSRVVDKLLFPKSANKSEESSTVKPNLLTRLVNFYKQSREIISLGELAAANKTV